MYTTQVKPLAPLSERGTRLQQTKAVQVYFTLNRLGLSAQYPLPPTGKHISKKKVTYESRNQGAKEPRRSKRDAGECDREKLEMERNVMGRN